MKYLKPLLIFFLLSFNLHAQSKDENYDTYPALCKKLRKIAKAECGDNPKCYWTVLATLIDLEEEELGPDPERPILACQF